MLENLVSAPGLRAIPCLRSALRSLRLRAYARRACANMRAAPARNAIRDDVRRIMNDAVQVCIRKCAYGQFDIDHQELQN